MFKNRKKAALIPLILFIIVCVVVLAIVSSKPYDRPTKNLSNGFGNAMNGAIAAGDGNIIYYIDAQGVLRCKGENDIYRIADNASCAFPYGTGIIYISDSDVCYSEFNGGGTKKLVKGVQFVEVSGRWIFYTKGDMLFKMRVGEDKEYPLSLKVGQYAVSGTYTYYIGDDGYLNYARNDGTQSKRFLDSKMKAFQLYDSNIFFINEKGELLSAYTGNTAYSDRRIAERCEQFVVSDSGMLLYYDGAKLYYRDLSEEDSETHESGAQFKTVSNLNVVGDNFYFYADGKLVKMKMDGSELTNM